MYFQSEISSYFYYYGLNLKRSFLKGKRLDVSVYAGNCFSKYRAYTTEIVTETFRSLSSNRSYSLYFGVGLSWRFGDLKVQVKRAGRTISNDDVQAGGNKPKAGR